MIYYLRKHWGANAAVVLLQILWAAMRVVQNVLVMGIFQSIIELDFRKFLMWLLLDLGACVLEGIFNCLRTWAKARAIRAMNNRVRGDMTASLLSRSYPEYHARSEGEYLSQFTNDLNRIETLAWDSVYGIISVGAQVLFSAIVLAGLHWSMLLVSAVTAGIMFFVPKMVGKRVEDLSDVCAREQALATAGFKDLLAGLDVLRAFGRTDRFVKGNAEASDRMEKPKYRLTCVQTVTEEVIGLVGAGIQFGVLALSGLLAIRGVIIQAAFSGAGNVCGTVCNGLTSIGQLILAARASKPYFEKITVHAAGPGQEGEQKMPAMERAITVENLGFRYGEHSVLEHASFRFEKGGKYALTGPSGCGKSTLLKLMLGQLPGYSGSIRFDGTDAKNFTADQLQQQMSYIAQDVFLFNATIRENVTLGEAVGEEELERALRDSALSGDLQNMPLGLETEVGEEGGNLSGGQKQRVAIARALIHNRSILLVDEGTSALDRKNADIVEESLLRNPDLTLILVSHHLSEERKAQFTDVFDLTKAV